MLSKTYFRIIRLFNANHGYMSFEQLRENGITVLQMRELEENGVLDRFCRGWYWCNECDVKKPADYKYIEIAKMNPNAIICLDSACFLAGVNVWEPKVVKVATARSDRKKMEISFPINRYFLTYTEVGRTVKTKITEFGSYRYFTADRALFDCLHAPCKVERENLILIEKAAVRYQDGIRRYETALQKIKAAEKQKRSRGRGNEE